MLLAQLFENDLGKSEYFAARCVATHITVALWNTKFQQTDVTLIKLFDMIFD